MKVEHLCLRMQADGLVTPPRPLGDKGGVVLLECVICFDSVGAGAYACNIQKLGHFVRLVEFRRTVELDLASTSYALFRVAIEEMMREQTRLVTRADTKTRQLSSIHQLKLSRRHLRFKEELWSKLQGEG